MMQITEEAGYSHLSFSLANPNGPTEMDVPLLLERAADFYEDEGSICLLDFTFHYGPDNDPKPYVTACFYRPSND